MLRVNRRTKFSMSLDGYCALQSCFMKQVKKKNCCYLLIIARFASVINKTRRVHEESYSRLFKWKLPSILGDGNLNP